MSTMEHLFMQIFDRKRWIEDQFKHQVESYGESLASNLLAEGRRPPPWLWTSASDDPSRPDPKDCNREQLICEILDPLPRVTTPANNQSLFILPTLEGKNVNLFNSNNFFTEAHASNKYFEVKARDESVSNDVSERSRRNSETVVEPNTSKKYSDGGQLSWTETSRTKHGEPDMPPSKKAKFIKYPVEENSLQKFTGRVTRSMAISLNSQPIKDGKASNSRSMIRKYHSTGQPSQPANPQNDVSSEPSMRIDYHAPNRFVDDLSLHAAHSVDNGCPSTNSISSRLSAITLVSEPEQYFDRIEACDLNESSVSAFEMENHERTLEIPELHADAANILSCPDSSHDRKLNENVSHALKTTGRAEPAGRDLTEGPTNETHHMYDLRHYSRLRCHDCQPSSTNNSRTDFKLSYFSGHSNEPQVGSRQISIDNLQKPTPEKQCSWKTELSESHLDISAINNQCDLNSVEGSHNGLEVKLNTALKDGFVSRYTSIEEDNLRRWKMTPEDVLDTVQTVLERDEVERVSNRGPEEGVKLPGGNSECIIQTASCADDSWIFGNGFSNLLLDREGPLNSSMDSTGHTSEPDDSSRKKAYRSLIQEQEKCCEKPKEVFLDVALSEKSESGYPAEKVHLHLREIKEYDSIGKRVDDSDRTNIVQDYDQAEGSDIIGTEDRKCYFPVCNGHASLPTMFLSEENASACSSPDPEIILNYMKGLSVQSNLLQENGTAKLLEIQMQYSKGGNDTGEPGTKRKVNSLKEADNVYCEGPVSLSETNGELSGFEETDDSAKEPLQRGTGRYIVSPGPSQSQNVILEGKPCVEELGTVNDKITPDARTVCNAVPKDRYFLRSSSSREKQQVSPESSRIDGSSNLKKVVDLCDITWPKRKYKGRANNALATSPRLRFKTQTHIDGQMECSCRESLNNTSGSRNDYQPFKSSCETEVALPEAAVGGPEEEHPSKKRRIMEADHDLEGKCKAVGTPLSARHVNKLDLDLTDEDSNTITESFVLNLEQSPALEGVESGFPRLDHRSLIEFGSFKESTSMEQVNAVEGIPNTHLHGLEETMPEFEGFSVSLPAVIEDEVIFNCSEIPSLSKERVSLLQQLSRSESMLTAKSCPSLKFNIEKIPDIHHSLPANILEKLNLSNPFHATDTESEEFSTAEDGKTSDPFSSFGSEFDVSLLRSHPYKLSCSNAKYAWEAGKLPLTPPVQKLQQRTMSGNSVASSEERGSNPELVCFRIDENSSTAEEFSEQGVGLRGVQASANRVALADVTSLYQNLPSSVSLCGKYLERGSLDSTNTIRQMEMDHKENDNLSASHSSIQRSVHRFGSQLNKGDASGRTNERKVGRTVSGKWLKPSNIVSNISSFIPLVREKQQTAAPAKRDIKVKALEVAEAAKRLQEKRQYEREMRKAAAKLERVRLEQENIQKLELKQKQKEESRRKKEADLEARKRQRDVERIGKERKKRCTEEGRKQQRAHFERSCVEKGHKELQDRNTNDKKRKGKELPREAKKQAQLERGREVAVNRKTAEVETNVSKVVSVQSGHGNSCEKAHGVLLEENHSKMVCDSYALQNAIQDRMSVTTEIQDTESYEISPYKDSDDEDGCEDHMRARKCVPSWARRESLQQILLSKRHLDPTKIFSCKRSFDLNEVLPRVQRRPLS